MTGVLEVKGRKAPAVAPYFRFTRDYLAQTFAGLKDRYRAASPFPHVVIDNFLPQDMLERVIAELPDPDKVTIRNNHDTQGKSALYKSERMELPDAIYNLISEMNSAVFLEAIEDLTGIGGLIPDPYMHCGGIHQTRRSGFLGIHADYNYLGELRLDRRLNILLYLNPGWQEEWGGHLGLWDKPVTKCEQQILPIANRLVIMDTDDHSWHGHPTPLTAPEDRTRNSIALYLYTSGRPKGQVRYRDLGTRYVAEGADKQRRGLKKLRYELTRFRKNFARMRKVREGIT